jgi:imidazolonepropionase-like amidohydrolase
LLSSRTRRRICSSLFLYAAAAHAQTTIIRAGRLIDPVTGAVATNQFIVVNDGRITRVGMGIPIRENSEVIDLSAFTVLPGLIDSHVHLAIGGPPRANALADLQAGFTTVVDLGARTTRLLRIRDSINAGQIPGPRVLAAGIWVGTQGGVCEFNGIGIAGGPDAFRARVRENVDGGADVIKVCVSGWPGAAYARPDAYEIADSSLIAVVAEAHGAKRLVIAHDISIGGIRAALRAGVDGLAHAAYVDSAAAGQLRDRNVFLIPTLASLTDGDTSAASRSLIAATQLAYRTGVPLVFGTDGGVLPHGQNAREFVVLGQAGVTPLDAIRAATVNAARALRLSDSLGAIRPGMIADIIAVEGDPLTDLHALSRVKFVMSRGNVVRR